MKLMNVYQPIRLSTDTVRGIIEHGLAHEWGPRCPTYFPVQWMFEAEARLEMLETPWLSKLEGCRIANFNGTGLRMLRREGGRVIWSTQLDHRNISQIYAQFVSFVDSSTSQLLNLGMWPDVDGIVFDLRTCADLLIASFVQETKPRVIPRIEWPPLSECVEVVRSIIPTLPWRLEGYWGSMILEMSKGQLLFEARGERGGLEKVSISADHDEVYAAVFKYVSNHDYFEKDSNFQANSFYFTTPT